MSVPATSSPKTRIRWALREGKDGPLLAGGAEWRTGNPRTFRTRADARKCARAEGLTGLVPVRIELTAGWRVLP